MGASLSVKATNRGANTFDTSGTPVDTTGCNLITVVCTYASAGAGTLSDSKGNTYTGRTEQYNSVAPACRIFECSNPTVGSGHYWTLTGSSIFGTLGAAGWLNAKLSSPFDQENGQGGAGFSGTATPGSITPGEDGEIIITGFGWNTSASMSVPGYTIGDSWDFQGGTNYGGGWAYLIQTPAAATNPAWTFSGSEGGNVTIASYKANADAPTLNSALGHCIPIQQRF